MKYSVLPLTNKGIVLSLQMGLGYDEDNNRGLWSQIYPMNKLLL